MNAFRRYCDKVAKRIHPKHGLTGNDLYQLWLPAKDDPLCLDPNWHVEWVGRRRFGVPAISHEAVAKTVWRFLRPEWFKSEGVTQFLMATPDTINPLLCRPPSYVKMDLATRVALDTLFVSHANKTLTEPVEDEMDFEILWEDEDE